MIRNESKNFLIQKLVFFLFFKLKSFHHFVNAIKVRMLTKIKLFKKLIMKLFKVKKKFPENCNSMELSLTISHLSGITPQPQNGGRACRKKKLTRWTGGRVDNVAHAFCNDYTLANELIQGLRMQGYRATDELVLVSIGVITPTTTRRRHAESTNRVSHRA